MTDTTTIHPEYGNAAEVRRLLGNISPPTLDRWTREAGLPAPRYVRGRRFWKLDEVRAWMDGQTRETEAPDGFDEGRKRAHEVKRQQAAERHGGAQ